MSPARLPSPSFPSPPRLYSLGLAYPNPLAWPRQSQAVEPHFIYLFPSAFFRSRPTARRSTELPRRRSPSWSRALSLPLRDSSSTHYGFFSRGLCSLSILLPNSHKRGLTNHRCYSDTNENVTLEYSCDLPTKINP